jgi:hypothetical protein
MARDGANSSVVAVDVIDASLWRDKTPDCAASLRAARFGTVLKPPSKKAQSSCSRLGA